MPRPFGFHIAGGTVSGSSLKSSIDAGFTAAQLFLGPPQRAATATIPLEEMRTFLEVKRTTKTNVFVHAPYVLHAFPRQENQSWNNQNLKKALHLTSVLECNGYVLHMGGTKWYLEAGYLPIAKQLLDDLNTTTPLLFENCASGNEMSGDLTAICGLIHSLRELGYQHLGLCLDTCHAWAWGYNLNDPLICKTLANIVRPYLNLIHLNSAPEIVECGGKYDRHESIAEGVISPIMIQQLLAQLPDVPVIVERSKLQDILSDWEYVKQADSLTPLYSSGAKSV